MTKKVLIICQSIHHGNSMKIAKAIGEVLHAEIKKPNEVKSISGYDLIGFGSGIYNGKHHESLFDFLVPLDIQNNKKVFIFSTASFKFMKMHKALRKKLVSKGFDIMGEFMCKGFMDYKFLKHFFGGLNKKRPNNKDIEDAKQFAENLIH